MFVNAFDKSINKQNKIKYLIPTVIMKTSTCGVAGVFRRTVLHRVHIEPVHDQRGQVLRHHQASRVRREADPSPDAGMCVTSVARCGVY